MDDDGGALTDSDHVDDIYITESLATSSSFTSEEWFHGNFGNSEIRLSFRVQCADGFFGSDCGTYCADTNSNNVGHYVCSVNGIKICSPADQWSDPSNECLTRKDFMSNPQASQLFPSFFLYKL